MPTKLIAAGALMLAVASTALACEGDGEGNGGGGVDPGRSADPAPPADPTSAACRDARPERGYDALWNGRDLAGWRHAGAGGWEIVGDPRGRGCALRSRGGLGLLWYARQRFSDFVLRLEWRTAEEGDNSGVFVRFPGPGNSPQVAVRDGYEIQIYDGREGETQMTGAIYDVEPPEARNSRPPGRWNEYAITVKGSPARITVRLNGRVVQRFRSSDPGRARAPGYVGIQNHGDGDLVAFREIRIRELGE